MDLDRWAAEIEARIAAVETGARASRLTHASIENTALSVYDGAGSLRAIVGLQSDGTTGLNVVNGGPPPTPSTPTVAPAVGGIAVGWDGTPAGGGVLPLDWARVEVHASTTNGFTPTAATLQATMETPRGAISYLPATAPTYVRLVARNTSGTASTATPQVGPYSPRPIAGEIGIGEIGNTMISDGAVTTPKLFANAVTTPKLDVGSVDATALKADAITGKIITGGEVNGSTVTGGYIRTAASGERITLNEAAANKVLVYDGVSASAIAELSKRGLLVQGTNGAILWLDPNNAFPNLRLTNVGATNSAIINVSGTAAVLGLNSGTFTGSTFADMKWRTLFGASGSSDIWAAERVRDSDTGTVIGGRILMGPTYASLTFKDSTNTALDAAATMFANLLQLDNGRLQIFPPATANPVIWMNAPTGQAGSLLSLQVNAADRFKVDKDGNVSNSGVLSAGNMASGNVSIVPSAANTPTSALVTYNVSGAVVRGYATANTTVPGSRVNATPSAAGVTGVGVSSVTNTSMLVWVNRENLTSTVVNWQAIGAPS